MQNRTGQNEARAAGMGPRQRQAGKAWHDKAAAANSRQMKLAGTGLAAKQPADEVTGTGLEAKTASR